MCQVGMIGKLLHLYVHQPVRTNLIRDPLYYQNLSGYCQNLRSTIVSIMFIEYDQFVTGKILHPVKMTHIYDSWYSFLYSITYVGSSWQVVIWPVASLIVNPNLTNSLWSLSLKKVLKHSVAIIINQLHHIHSKTILPPLTKHPDAWFVIHPVYY